MMFLTSHNGQVLSFVALSGLETDPPEVPLLASVMTATIRKPSGVEESTFGSSNVISPGCVGRGVRTLSPS
jgi:hypothetical protein